MSIPVLATVTCLLATAVLVAAEWRHWMLARTLAKLAASGSFIVIGTEALRAEHEGVRAAYAVWVMIGLAFGAVGDILLLGKSTRAFLAGLVAFLIGHLAYVVAFSYLVSPGRWLDGGGSLAFAAAPTIIGVAAVALLWPRLGSMKGPVVAYLVAIVTMVIAALAAWRLHALPQPASSYLIIGAALFFVSDLSVARNRFVGDSITNKVWGLPAYFGGQLLIAWSAL